MEFSLIAPMPITDAELVASNIPEDDAPEWRADTPYDAGARVLHRGTHRLYESLGPANLGNDPTRDDGSHWFDLRATNRWRAFDQGRSSRAARADEITYSLVPSRDCDVISLFGLTAGEVAITVSDATGVIWQQTFPLAQTDGVVGPYTWFFGGVTYARQKVLGGFPGFLGHRIDIAIRAPGAVAEVGHIVLGLNRMLGRVVGTPEIAHVSHSRKDFDDFGDEILVRRGSTRKLTVPLLVPTLQGPRVMDVIAEVDGLVTAFHATTDGPSSYGLEGLGFVDDHTQPLEAGGESLFTLVIKTIK